MTADSTSSNSGPSPRAPGARRPRPHRNRLLLPDLDRFPDLAATMRDQEIQRIYHTATRKLAAHQATPKEPKRDWPALAAVRAGAIFISWRLCNRFGQHPAGIAQDRDIAAHVELAAGVLDADADQHQATTTSNKPP